MLPDNQRRQPRVNKQIIFIVCIYIVLTVSNRFSANNNQSDQAIIKKLENQTTVIPMSTLLSEIDKEKIQGQWVQTRIAEPTLFSRDSGKFQMQIMRRSQGENQRFSIDLKIKNGQYIDDGQISLRISELQSQNFIIQHTPNKLSCKISLNSTQQQTIPYISQQIFQTKAHSAITISSIEFILQVLSPSTSPSSSSSPRLSKTLLLSTPSPLSLSLHPQQYNMSGTILLALILFLVSYSQFSACMQIIKRFLQGEEEPSNYSFITIMMAMMWDAALCLTAFIQAFENQENIVLFIVPAFMLCVLFTNLQLRVMVIIFKSLHNETDIRNIICKFNFFSYGAIISMYPILLLTNMGPMLFIPFSLLFLPQIYNNAILSKRPNPNSVYYNEFLLYRFLLILYLKCFPYNVFNLKPNYVLGFGCLGIVACQFGLLWVQRIYGARRVLPGFLLPVVYDYRSDVGNGEADEQAEQCVICLEGLNKNPEPAAQNIQVVHRIMKTPCGHKYHGVCLVQWMNLKMECPKCRAKLPAYQ